MSDQPDVLARICAAKRQELAQTQAEVPQVELRACVADRPPCRGFLAALRGAGAAGKLALIAEIKQASPSKGLIRADFDPASLALAYRDGGATCLSVLTEGKFFRGHPDHLAAARAAGGLPVLRKDFILEPYQVYETRAWGADCLLLIMAALADQRARELGSLALELGLDVLVEVHDRAELERALRVPSTMIGINNRNLKTLKVDLQTTVELAPLVPADRLLVAESGLVTLADLERMRAVGAGAFLVGESLMRQADVTAATRVLLGLAAA